MSIKDEIAAAFKEARKARDDQAKQVITMLRAKMTNELKSGSGAEENDETWLKVLAAYNKELKKSLTAYEDLGDAGKEAADGVKYEMAFCGKYLPSKLDAAATTELVKKIAAEQGLSEKKDMGRLMGAIMKNHKDEVDGDLVRKAAGQVLS